MKFIMVDDASPVFIMMQTRLLQILWTRENASDKVMALQLQSLGEPNFLVDVHGFPLDDDDDDDDDDDYSDDNNNDE